MAAGRRAWVAAAFALAAVFSCWNPLAAPFGLLVGLCALVLSIRALSRGAGWRVAAVGLLLSLMAVVVSGLVLALTAGVGREPTGEPVVAGPPAAEVARQLDAAEEQTRAARGRARAELEATGGGGESPPAKAAPAPARR